MSGVKTFEKPKTAGHYTLELANEEPQIVRIEERHNILIVHTDFQLYYLEDNFFEGALWSVTPIEAECE